MEDGQVAEEDPEDLEYHSAISEFEPAATTAPPRIPMMMKRTTRLMRPLQSTLLKSALLSKVVCTPLPLSNFWTSGLTITTTQQLVILLQIRTPNLPRC